MLSKHRRLLAQPGVSPRRRAADMTAQPAHVDTEQHYRPSIASEEKCTQTNRGTVTPQEAPRVRREAISQEDQLEPTRIKDSWNYLQTAMRPRPDPLCYIVVLVSNLGVLLKDLLLYFSQQVQHLFTQSARSYPCVPRCCRLADTHTHTHTHTHTRRNTSSALRRAAA